MVSHARTHGPVTHLFTRQFSWNLLDCFHPRQRDFHPRRARKNNHRCRKQEVSLLAFVTFSRITLSQVRTEANCSCFKLRSLFYLKLNASEATGTSSLATCRKLKRLEKMWLRRGSDGRAWNRRKDAQVVLIINYERDAFKRKIINSRKLQEMGLLWKYRSN